MPPRSLIARLLGVGIIVMCGSAAATEITVSPPSPGQPTTIYVNGPLTWEAADQFIRTTHAISSAIVFFHSEGGELLAGLIMGQTIRQKKFSTAVKTGEPCTSTCAVTWLAGVERFLEPGARVGFRAADPSGTGKVSLDAYLNEVGISSQAKAYITEISSEGVNWLDQTQAEKHGFVVSTWGSVAKTPPLVPEGPSGSLWYYYGSTLSLISDGQQRRFYYETPRPELVALGIQRGTLFFIGYQKALAYRGSVFVFSRQCGATPYHVRGEISKDNQTIVLRGNAPSLDERCRIRTTWQATMLLIRGEHRPADEPVSSIPSPRRQ